MKMPKPLRVKGLEAEAANDLLSVPVAGKLDARLSQLLPWVMHVFGREPTEDDMRTERFAEAVRQELYLQGLVFYFSWGAAALHAGVSLQQANGWRRRLPEFVEWCEEARRVAVDMTEGGLMARSRAGDMNAYVVLQARRGESYTYNARRDSGGPSQIQVVIMNQLPDGSLSTVEPTNFGTREIVTHKVEVLTDGS